MHLQSSLTYEPPSSSLAMAFTELQWPHLGSKHSRRPANLSSKKWTRILGCKLSDVIEEGPNAILNKSENAQPAIMAVSIMILRVLENEFRLQA